MNNCELWWDGEGPDPRGAPRDRYERMVYGAPRCKGNSKTQSSSTTSSEVNDSRVAASENSIAVGAGGSYTAYNSDATTFGNIIDAASKMFETATAETNATTRALSDNSALMLAETGDVLKDVNKQALSVINNAVNTSMDVARTAMQSTEETAALGIQAVGAANKSESATVAQDTIKGVITVAAISAAAYILTNSN